MIYSHSTPVDITRAGFAATAAPSAPAKALR